MSTDRADSWDPSDMYREMQGRAVKAPEPGLSATESAERGEVDPAVELVARRQHPAECGEEEPYEECVFRPEHEAAATDAVEALRSAGRLLPPVVQTREEWEVQTRGVRYPCSTLEAAWRQFGEIKGTWAPDAKVLVRTITTFADDGSPYGGATLTSAWRAVEGGEE